MSRSTLSDNALDFYGGRAAVFVALLLFCACATALFSFANRFDMTALAAAALATLLTLGLLARRPAQFWSCAVEGAASSLTATIVLVLLLAGIMSELVKAGGAAQSLAALGRLLELGPRGYTLFTLAAATLVGTATGSSIGTLLAAGPLLLPAGAALGADPALLSGALLSGAIFGDHLSPVSDVTLISATTQTDERGQTPAISRVVATRLPYSLTALAFAAAGYALMAGESPAAAAVVPEGTDLAGLVMLAPVAIVVGVSVKTRDVLAALAAGTAAAAVTGLVFGRFDAAALFDPSKGLIVSGFASMQGIALMCALLLTLTHVAQESGVTATLARGLAAGTRRGGALRAEAALAAAVLVVTTLLAAVTSAAVAFVGAVANDAESNVKIDPVRRAHLLTGFANALPVLAPFSAFILITTGVADAAFGEGAVRAPTLALTTLYPAALFLVMTFSVATGFGRSTQKENLQ